VLSSAVCMQCVASKALTKPYGGYDPITAHDWWSSSDNDRWNFKGVVYCRLFDGRRFKQADINGQAPEWCPYRLEHAIYTGLVCRHAL